MKALTVVRGSDWQQESYESASRDAARRAKQLRSLGFQVSVSPMGPQVTQYGILSLSLVSIRNITYGSEIPPVETV